MLVSALNFWFRTELVSTQNLRPDLNGALFAYRRDFLFIKKFFEGKKAGVEGGPDNPESFRDRDWRPKSSKIMYFWIYEKKSASDLYRRNDRNGKRL